MQDITSSERILAGASIKTYELDEEEQKGLEKRISDVYDSAIIISSIGAEDFKSNFMISKDSIRKQPIEEQRDLCFSILDRIEELYEFVFPESISLEGQKDFDEVYAFIEFLEYDNIEFLDRLWDFLGVNLKEIDVEEYCNSNSLKIMKEVDEVVEISNMTEMVSIFLRTYYKLGMIRFIISNTVKNKMEIVLRILQKGE